MIASVLEFLAVLLVGSLTLVAIGIGRFYRLKFGESTRSLFLSTGVVIGVLGKGLQIIPGLPYALGDLVTVIGAIVMGIGIFWLWFVMLGPRR